jgi:hypothetical protein
MWYTLKHTMKNQLTLTLIFACSLQAQSGLFFRAGSSFARALHSRGLILSTCCTGSSYARALLFKQALPSRGLVLRAGSPCTLPLSFLLAGSFFARALPTCRLFICSGSSCVRAFSLRGLFLRAGSSFKRTIRMVCLMLLSSSLKFFYSKII